jgi:hypothetical protein
MTCVFFDQSTWLKWLIQLFVNWTSNQVGEMNWLPWWKWTMTSSQMEHLIKLNKNKWHGP